MCGKGVQGRNFLPAAVAHAQTLELWITTTTASVD
jgi:hypothetical protein